MKAQELVEKKLKKYSAKQLLTKLEKGNLTKIEKEVAIEILNKRGQDVSMFIEQPVEKVEEEQPTTEDQDFEIDNLKGEVDLFVDELITANRTGVYTEVMKALGGNYESDLEELLDVATIEQLKEALSFKKIKSSEDKKPTVEKTSTPKPTTTIKKESKSVILEEAEENKGLKNGVEVEFKAAGNSKFPNEMITGKVDKVYKCHKANMKEYCKIVSEKGTFYKRTNSVKVL